MSHSSGHRTSYLIKVYHNFAHGKNAIVNFLADVANAMTHNPFTLGINYVKGEIFYSVTASEKTYPNFETQFYTHFNDFQITPDDRWVRQFDKNKSIVWQITLDNSWFFPFKMDESDDTDFAINLFRAFENFDVLNDRVGIFFNVEAVHHQWIKYYFLFKRAYKIFKRKLALQFYKYMFNSKIQKDWKMVGEHYFEHKKQHHLLKVKIFLVVQSANKATAEGRMRSLFNNFLTLNNYPLNEFGIRMFSVDKAPIAWLKQGKIPFGVYYMTDHELAHLYHFPKNPSGESSLLTVKAKKLAIPVGMPTVPYDIVANNEVLPKNAPQDMNVVGISDYRSIRVPIAMYDEDRLRHFYIVGKTGTGKSKFQLSMMINDINQGKGIGIIDPHGELVDDIMMHIPESRKNDVVIFDPTDEQFPFCLNPLDVQRNESKMILARWFIDIFKKFFGSNWNTKLEHVLRMIFLALLDKKDSTLFDIIRALTDKDFRYTMIEDINDDVVRNFWTNEFAWRSQQFNTEAIMPILNKVGQLLSIDILKNIFASPVNKLDFRDVMDSSKILLIKISKWKLQEEVMWFLGAMFVTKLFQTAMSRHDVDKSDRIPFFLYVDEFQNFATETFKEILSEARKYGLWLTVAHQFLDQIPSDISDALFGNVGTLVSFRISSDDAEKMKNHFAPFLTGYDIANLNMREFYCKMLVKWQVKDPLSLKSAYTPDVKVAHDRVEQLYNISRAKYNRSLAEAKAAVETQKDVVAAIEEFIEPMI